MKEISFDLYISEDYLVCLFTVNENVIQPNWRFKHYARRIKPLTFHSQQCANNPREKIHRHT